MLTNHIKLFLSKTRNQMLIGFIIVMTIVLIIAQLSNYFILSRQLREDSRKYIKAIIGQMQVRLNDFLKEIDNETLELSLNRDIQEILYKSKFGEEISLREKFRIRDIFINFKTFSPMIKSIDLHSLNKTIYPIDNVKLSKKYNPNWLEKADKANGKLVWIGLDPIYPQDLVAVREVRIINDKYKKGGYILIRIVKELLLYIDKDLADFNDFLFYLIDSSGRVISTNNDKNLFRNDWLNKEFININNNRYFSMKQGIDRTNWTLIILSPFNRITEGTSNIIKILIIVGIIGTVLFIILSIFLSSLITRPIHKLISVMEHDSNGLLKPNPETYYNHEINELNSNYNKMVAENNHLVKVVYEKEISRTKAEIAAIQAQINPHFLYNTLEAFYWTLLEHEEEELSNLLLSLSSLFRYTINSGNDDGFIQLKAEIKHISRYLEIMRFRLGDRLEWDVNLPENYSALIIPKLTIQPLVENAIIHGIENKIGQGYIKVNVTNLSKNLIEIIVIDNGKGISKKKLLKIQDSLDSSVHLNSNNIGLKNIHKRLQANYGDEAKLIILSKKNEGTKVKLIIPIKKL